MDIYTCVYTVTGEINSSHLEKDTYDITFGSGISGIRIFLTKLQAEELSEKLFQALILKKEVCG